MDNDVKVKYSRLQQNLKLYGKAAVAFSGGLSSAFLLRTALAVLGVENILAITALSKSIPDEERLRSQALIKEWGIKQVFAETEFWKVAAQHNSSRSKACREHLFKKIVQTALDLGYDLVLDGATVDDPMSKFEIETGNSMLVKPIMQANLSKPDLRKIAMHEGWMIYDVPSDNNLISRFDHGRDITAVDLERVKRAETLMRNLGFTNVRVRDHGHVARVEVDDENWDRFRDHKLREIVYIGLQSLGYHYSTLDIRGYRHGSMDEYHGEHIETNNKHS